MKLVYSELHPKSLQCLRDMVTMLMIMNQKYPRKPQFAEVAFCKYETSRLTAAAIKPRLCETMSCSTLENKGLGRAHTTSSFNCRRKECWIAQRRWAVLIAKARKPEWCEDKELFEGERLDGIILCSVGAFSLDRSSYRESSNLVKTSCSGRQEARPSRLLRGRSGA